ncbi:hypothetical protein FQR65_LT02760 [Abscondita terminalis]|nr:hypothetical protein FQR65_LT02760 [Abscondita terminalis]
MNNHSIRWIILVSILFLTSFGSLWCLTFVACVSTFALGLISLLYVQQGDIDKFYKKCAGNPLTIEDTSEGGLKQVVDLFKNGKQFSKTDRRVTGSELIDNSLQEILGYIIRDYVTPWYHLISLHDEFPESTVRKTSQSLAINISNRIKDIDWIPFLTTKLVDDAASHLRLFKQARIKIENSNKFKMQQNSPGKDAKNTKKTLHKRNKSEADITKYAGSNEKHVGNSKFYVPDSTTTLEDYFFELECQMESNTICRDLVCTDATREKEFLSEVVELLLYILLPDEDFQCKPLRIVLREIFCSYVISPLISMISNPDFINQSIIWLCARDNYLPSEIFLSTLRLTDNCDELRYTRELVAKEIQLLRSRDSGGESDISIKQQLSSLFYVTKLIDNRLSKIHNVEGPDTNNALESVKTIKLPLNIILKNNVALSYFIDYVTLTGKQSYLFFFLNIEGWKISVEQQLSDMHINKIKSSSESISAMYDNIRTTALNIYDQYLGDKAQHKIYVKPFLVQSLFFKIKNLTEPPSELWFDEVQAAVYDCLQDDFLPAFHESTSYLKLLEELDLVQQNIVEDDAISISSLENAETNSAEKRSTSSNNSDSSLPNKSSKHVRSFSDITEFGASIDKNINDRNFESSQKENGTAVVVIDGPGIETQDCDKKKEDVKTGEFSLSVEIIETGIVCEKGKTFGVYAVHVSRQFKTGFLEEWHVYRRYSDFYDLHTKIKEKYPDLSKIPFPGKKTFHNMERSVLERRMRMLGYYLQQLCQAHVLSSHSALKSMLMTFLEQGDYDRATSGGPISHTIDTIVNPLKSGMKTIKNMPEQLFNTVDEVVEGLSKVFHTKSNRIPEASKVGASLDIESDDNIPLRIMLLLMDEVFDLKSRNQWLRRRIVTLLRQIVRTMFGDIVNRRILDYVSYITSPKNVAQYLHTFKHSFWPHGVKAEKPTERDESTYYRTRIAAKVALLSWLSDELKHIIGSETTRRGLLTIFELFQRPVLNRRLLYVLLEGILTSLFPEKNMSNIFQKLYTKCRSTPSKFKDCDTRTNR